MTFSGDFLPGNFFGIHRIYKVIFVPLRKTFLGGIFILAYLSLVWILL